MIPVRPCLALSDTDYVSLNEKHSLLHNFPQVLVEPLRAGTFCMLHRSILEWSLSHTDPTLDHLDYVFDTKEAAFRNDPLREYLLAVSLYFSYLVLRVIV